MGRYETLNDDSKDVVNCLLPGIAANFQVDDIVKVIPEDIRMRHWDVDRREHVYDKADNDARDWGLQFLKDLVTISRLMKGKLDKFHGLLRDKVEAHSPEHPWAKLQDIKDIKADLTAPPPPADDARNDVQVISSSESEESMYELIEKETEGPKKRGRKPLEARKLESAYVASQQTKKPRKSTSKKGAKRLRRSEGDSWERPSKSRGCSLGGTSGRDNESNDRDSELPNLSPSLASAATEEFANHTLAELEEELELAESLYRAKLLRVQVSKARRQKANGIAVDQDDFDGNALDKTNFGSDALEEGDFVVPNAVVQEPADEYEAELAIEVVPKTEDEDE